MFCLQGPVGPAGAPGFPGSPGAKVCTDHIIINQHFSVVKNKAVKAWGVSLEPFLVIASSVSYFITQ